jgi:malate dehydrogenase (oxaloacetate-decarboxylating)(NADP+)
VQEVFPRACIQFEDWAGEDAVKLLARYRDRVCCFNDDIQGTGSMALAGIFGALRLSGGRLEDQRFLFLGAGSAGIGIAGSLTDALTLEGLSLREARQRCWLFDVNGLIESTRTGLAPFQEPFAHAHAPTRDFVAAIESIKPTAIIGVSTVAKSFSQPVIEAMSRLNRRPIILPLSNPTSRSECTAEEAYRWSEGRAIFGSGSPFGPVEAGGRTLVPRQANNVYIFPGVGLGVVASGARRVTDEMFIAAARALAALVTPAELDAGSIYPALGRIREVSLDIATAVAELAWSRGLTSLPKPTDVRAHVAAHVYQPDYPSYEALAPAAPQPAP